jgi:uncharacterized membrane protein YhaH (DUF805 family)
MEPAARRSALERWKPRAAGRTQLLLAGALWSIVGALLLFFGARWTFEAFDGRSGWLPTGLAVVVGLLKGRFVLDRTARRVTDRIASRGDGRCAGGFLSWRSWLLVALMSAVGRLLRGGLLSHAVVGPLYTAIGTGLLFSSRTAWRRWRATVNP